MGWLDSAWKDCYAKDGTTRVKKAFQRCGMLNALDCSEDHIITIECCLNYSLDRPAVTINMENERYI